MNTQARTQSISVLKWIMRREQPEPMISEARPRTRGECCDGPRPCPWTGCRYHLAFEVTDTGAIMWNGWARDVDHLDQEEHTCALDVADEGPHILDDVGRLLHLTRERVRQIELVALRKIARFMPELVHFMEEA